MIDNINELTSQLNPLGAPTRLELVAKEIILRAQSTCSMLESENNQLKNELEMERRLHSETRDRLASAEQTDRQTNEEITALRQQVDTLKEQNEALQTKVLGEDEYNFYLGSKTLKVCQTKGEGTFTFDELTDVGLPEEIREEIDTRQGVTVPGFLLKKNEGRVVITRRTT